MQKIQNTQQTAGWKDGQTLFPRTLPATVRGPASTIAVDWHLKVKYIDYVGLTRNYCLTGQHGKNQLNS